MSPVIFASETITPSVSTTGVHEWPAPATRTVRPSSAQRRTISCSSDSVSGSRISSGSQLMLPDQLAQPASSWSSSSRMSWATTTHPIPRPPDMPSSRAGRFRPGENPIACAGRRRGQWTRERSRRAHRRDLLGVVELVEPEVASSLWRDGLLVGTDRILIWEVDRDLEGCFLVGRVEHADRLVAGHLRLRAGAFLGDVPLRNRPRLFAGHVCSNDREAENTAACTRRRSRVQRVFDGDPELRCS